MPPTLIDPTANISVPLSATATTTATTESSPSLSSPRGPPNTTPLSVTQPVIPKSQSDYMPLPDPEDRSPYLLGAGAGDRPATAPIPSALTAAASHPGFHQRHPNLDTDITGHYPLDRDSRYGPVFVKSNTVSTLDVSSDPYGPRGGGGGGAQGEKHSGATKQDAPFPGGSRGDPPAPRTAYQRYMTWYEKYKWLMLACHYAFIVFNCAVVYAITLVIDTTGASENQDVAISYINYAKYISLITLPMWVYITIVTCSPKAFGLNNKLWFALFKMGRRGRFWWWYIFINLTQTCLWVVVMVLFWDSNFLCYRMGESAELNPFKVCGGVWEALMGTASPVASCC
ncbi:hypothetical protein DFJ73DRAFT_312528 [Zopfochytrium polystomum]|nr:hypothetical protein DFJ73DRAFT_312528 [Zopfochytrium polystomum]